MAFFGIGHLEHIPPQQKNAFRGVRGGTGGPPGPPGGAFSRAFRVFQQKTLNWFMKEVEIDQSDLTLQIYFCPI